MIGAPGESRRSPGGGPMSVEEIEHELGRLRQNEDGTLGLRASVLNLIVVTDEESAADITGHVSKLAGQYPARAIVLISDPAEGRANLDFGLSAFCSVRSGGSAQVCAEQITIHAEGPPAEHLETLAGPLLISDLPTFLWYPDGLSPSSPEFAGLAEIADRVILDSASSAGGDCGLSFGELVELLEREDAPAIGDLQWVRLSPWRALVAESFNQAERAGELGRIRSVEIMHAPDGECRALLFVGWLASRLGWEPRSARDTGEEGREVSFAGPSGEVVASLSPASSGARFRSVRLHSDEYTYEVARNRDLSEARTTVKRGDETLGELAVHLGNFDLGAVLGEELRFRGRDEVYEAALRMAVEVLDL